MAFSIIAAVWGVIFYLVYQITRISKLGKEYDASQPKSVKRVKESEYAIE
jgi:hypothetical protein